MKKNTKKIGVLMLASLMIFNGTACGKETKESEHTGETQTIETELVTKPYFEETREEIELDVPSDVDAMRPILFGLCKAMTKGASYEPTDAAFFWNALYASINGNTWIHPDIALSDDGAGYTVPKAVMEEYAHAMFSDVNELLELPSTVAEIAYDEANESYIVYSAGGISGTMDIVAFEETENGYEVSVAFNGKNGVIENHTVLMTNDGSGSFPCAVYQVTD